MTNIDRLTAALEDRYRIEREIGAGGMATVYLAEDLKHGRQVALKVLRSELASTMGPERFPDCSNVRLAPGASGIACVVIEARRDLHVIDGFDPARETR